MFLQIFVVSFVVASVFVVAGSGTPVNATSTAAPVNGTETRLEFDAKDVIPPADSPLKHLDDAQGDKKYVEFINELYQHDKTKTPLQFTDSKRQD